MNNDNDEHRFETALGKANETYERYSRSKPVDVSRLDVLQAGTDRGQEDAEVADPKLLDEGLLAAEGALSLASTPLQHQQALNLLGLLHRARYWRFFSLTDLNRSIDAFKKSISLNPKHKSHVPTVYGFGVSLLERAQAEKDAGLLEDAHRDLDEAIDRLHLVFRIVKVNRRKNDWPYIKARDQLGAAYRERYVLRGKRRDFRRSVACHKEAFDLIRPLRRGLVLGIGDPDHVYRESAVCAYNNGEIFLAHYKRTGHAPSLLSALDFFELSLENKFDPVFLLSAGHAYAELHKLTGERQAEDRGIWCFRQACEQGLAFAPLVALHSARAWLSWLLDGTHLDVMAKADGPDGPVEAANLGWEATQRLVSIQVDRQFEARARRQVVGFGAEAAYIFTQRGLTRRALLVAESTAASLAGEVQRQLKSELEALTEEGHGELARRYQALAGAPFGEPLSAAEGSSTAELETVKAQIRGVPGHGRFAYAADPVDLHQQVGRSEDWLYLLASPWGTTALLIRADGSLASTTVRGLTRDRVQRIQKNLSCLSERRVLTRNRDSLASDAVKSLSDALWDPLYSDLELGSRSLTLFPGGLLGVLPIEAARLASRGRPGRSDHRVRTFPSAALLYRSRPGRRVKLERGLVVLRLDLPAATRDLQTVRQAFGDANVETYVASGASDEDQDLRTELVTRSFVHFACHGKADLLDPDASTIELGNGKELELASLWMLGLDHTRLVVIATCQSAATGGSLIDDLVTFPTLFLRAGAGAVLGTLWNVRDKAAAELMDMFYTWLARGHEPVDALHRCQLSFIESRGERPTHTPRGPADWAALVCYG